MNEKEKDNYIKVLEEIVNQIDPLRDNEVLLEMKNSPKRANMLLKNDIITFRNGEKAYALNRYAFCNSERSFDIRNYQDDFRYYEKKILCNYDIIKIERVNKIENNTFTLNVIWEEKNN